MQRCRGGPVCVVALHAVAGNGRIDERRVTSRHAVWIEAESLESTEAHVRDQYVGIGDQLLGDRRAVVAGEIEGDASLRAVVHLEDRVVRHLCAEHRTKRAARVATERFDLDDFSAPIGEDAAACRPGDPHAELDNLHTIERSRHRSSLPANTMCRGGRRAR